MQTHVTLFTLFLWLVALQIKHFIADAPLQSHILARQSHACQQLRPLVSCASVHGFLTVLIFVFPLGWWAVLFGAFDAALHFLIDYWRTQIVKYTIYQPRFWFTLGLDNLMHHLAYVAMVFIAARQYLF